MANLLGQNIGTNYKGILNLNTLNGNLSATLQAVTDGDGNASLLRLSTSQAAFAGFAGASTADIVWRTNPTLTEYTGWHQSDGTFRIMTKDNSPLFINIGQNVSFLNGLAGQSIMTSNGALGLGVTTGLLGRLHVRGDGTNPVFRGESSAGANFVTINNSGQLFFGSAAANQPYIVNFDGASPGTESGAGQALRIRQKANINGTLMQYHAEGLFNNTTSGTNISHHFLSSGYAGAAGSGNYRATQIEYTINNSGAQTGTGTGIFLNATETNLNGMGHNLMDLKVGGVSQFTVSSTGNITAQGNIAIGNTVATAVSVASTHKVTINIGGTTYYLLASNV